jgi:hypothetical protein
MSTRKRSRSSYSNSNSNNNTVTRIVETPKRSKKRMIEVRMSIDDYNSYTDYKRYMERNNIDIPSGQSEYSQRLANLDIEHKTLLESYKKLDLDNKELYIKHTKLLKSYNLLKKRYKDLIKNCLEEKKVNRYGIKTSTSKKGNRKSRTIKTGNFNEEAALRKLGMNGIQIGLELPNETNT